MFNSLSKLADKSFVLGFFLPAFICTVAIVALTRDLPPLDAFLRDWTQQKTFANLTVTLLAIWTSSVLLMAGSHWMYRVLEGYAWPLNSKFLRERQLERRKSHREKMRQAYQTIARTSSSSETDMAADADADAARERDRLEDEVRFAYMRLRRESLLEYPEQRELVLPTRFGNVLRAFEMYAGNVYGVESIHAWPRLLAVVPSEYQTALADARARRFLRECGVPLSTRRRGCTRAEHRRPRGQRGYRHRRNVLRHRRTGVRDQPGGVSSGNVIGHRMGRGRQERVRYLSPRTRESARLQTSRQHR
jgi:hypothetical protein